MNKDKQIDEMAKVLKEHTKEHRIMASHPILKGYAEALYKAGYRKSSDIAREIFDIIDDIVEMWKLETRSKETGTLIRIAYNGTMIAKYIAELKKKYTEEVK